MEVFIFQFKITNEGVVHFQFTVVSPNKSEKKPMPPTLTYLSDLNVLFLSCVSSILFRYNADMVRWNF